MKPLSQQALELQQPQSAWDSVLEFLLTSLLVFAPLAYGAWDAWSEAVVVGAAGLISLVLAVKLLFSRDVRFTWTWAYLPIALFLGLVFLQLAPLPAHVVGSLSPRTLSLKTELLGDLPDASSVLNKLTLSFYPLATRHQLRLLLAVSSIFVVVPNVYRRPAQIKRLLTAIAIVGSAVALLAVYQNLTGTRMIYGLRPMDHPNSGPFANHSHFGQFMNLSMGAMLALILVRVGEITRGAETSADAVQQFKDSHVISVWILGAGVLVSAATIFLCLSRGAVVSMLLAGIITGLLFAWRRGMDRQAVLVSVGVAALLCVLLAGFGLVFERLATLREVTVVNADRFQIVRDLSRCWHQFPLIGTGLGTHEFVYPMFDRATSAALATHAENEYAELMEECGGAGAVLCLAFIAIMVANYLRIIWRPRRSIHLAGFGIGFGLLAILIHSLSDFGQHMPANALLTAVYCGLLVSLARFGRHREEPATAAPSFYSRPVFVLPVRLAAIALVALAFYLPIRQAVAHTNAQAAWDEVLQRRYALNQRGWEGADVADYVGLLKPAMRAAEIEPRDVNFQYWLANFRWRVISPGPNRPAIPQAQLAAFCTRIVSDLDVARSSCPTFGRLYALEGQLERAVLKSTLGAEHIQTGYRLNPSDPTSCLAMAELKADQQKWSDAVEAARRAIALDYQTQPAVLTTFVRRGRPDLAYQLVQENRVGLNTLAALLKDFDLDPELASRCRDEATQLLLAEAQKRSADVNVLVDAADVYASEGKDRLAIDCYERALSHNYNLVDSRFRLAVLLNKVGEVDNAVREARVCLRQRPDMKSAEELIASAGSRPGADR